MADQTPFETTVVEQNPKPVRSRSLHLIIIAVTVFLLLSAAFGWYFLSQQDESSPNGDVVYSNTDGSVKQVEDYIKQNYLSDPDSFTPIHWSKLQKTNAFGMISYKIGIVYKGKNKNNEVVMDSKIFDLNEDGSVMFVMDSAPMHFK